MNGLGKGLGIVLLVAACGGERPAEPRETATQRVVRTARETGARLVGRDRVDARMSPEELAQQRRDASWRRLASFRAARAAALRREREAAPAVTFRAPESFDETLDGVDWGSIDRLPVTVPIRGDVSGPSVFRTQLLLDRADFAPGVIDGHWGKNTEIALYWFQKANGLEANGEVDERTFRLLAASGGDGGTVTQYTVSRDDVDGPFVPIPEDVYEKAELDCLCYENAAELLAETFHTTPEMLALLNPRIDLAALSEGTRLLVPNVRRDESDAEDVDKIVVSVEGNYLHALDASGSILMHAPTTVGSEYDPSPQETLKLVGTAWDPTFHYQPTLFHEVPDEEPEAILPPGPNSPVGVVWMELSKDNYGIHGTSDPSSIGYASSHGCIRLTNWSARRLGRRAAQGTVVDFVDTRD